MKIRDVYKVDVKLRKVDQIPLLSIKMTSKSRIFPSHNNILLNTQSLQI